MSFVDYPKIKNKKNVKLRLRSIEIKSFSNLHSLQLHRMLTSAIVARLFAVALYQLILGPFGKFFEANFWQYLFKLFRACLASGQFRTCICNFAALRVVFRVSIESASFITMQMFYKLFVLINVLYFV